MDEVKYCPFCGEPLVKVRTDAGEFPTCIKSQLFFETLVSPRANVVGSTAALIGMVTVERLVVNF